MQLEKVFELEDISRNTGSGDRYAYSAFVIDSKISVHEWYNTTCKEMLWQQTRGKKV